MNGRFVSDLGVVDDDVVRWRVADYFDFCFFAARSISHRRSQAGEVAGFSSGLVLTTAGDSCPARSRAAAFTDAWRVGRGCVVSFRISGVVVAAAVGAGVVSSTAATGAVSTGECDAFAASITGVVVDSDDAVAGVCERKTPTVPATVKITKTPAAASHLPRPADLFSVVSSDKLAVVATCGAKVGSGMANSPASLGASTGGKALDDDEASAMSFFRSIRPESSNEAVLAAEDCGSTFATSAFSETTELSSFEPDKPLLDTDD